MGVSAGGGALGGLLLGGGGDRGDTDAFFVLLEVDFVVPPDFDPHAVGQGVDDRRADAMQAAGDLVGAFVKLAAGVKGGVGDFQSGDFGLGVHIGGDTPAVVLDGDGAVRVEGNPDVLGKAGQGFVYRVVHDFPDQVVQALAVSAAYVHPGALSNRLQAFEDLDTGGVVVGGRGLCRHARGILPIPYLQFNLTNVFGV